VLTIELNQGVNVSSMVTLMNRHRNSEGFCRTCAEPWPCDVRIIEKMLIVRGD